MMKKKRKRKKRKMTRREVSMFYGLLELKEVREITGRRTVLWLLP